MARVYNKINLPTNTTDIQMFYNYLSAIKAKGIVRKDEEKSLFATVKIKSSRKNVENPKDDTHTKQTLSLFGLIEIKEDESFSVSPLGEEVISYYENPSEQTELKRTALMLKVFLQWEINDEKFNRHMHPGYLIVKLLCDTDLEFYITNQELADLVMRENYISDDQYDEIKNNLLEFRKGIGISKYVSQTKVRTFLSTFVNNWKFMNCEKVVLSNKQYNYGLSLFKRYLAAGNGNEPDADDDFSNDESEVNTEEEVESIESVDTSSLTASQKNALSDFTTINKYSLNGLASYIAHLHLYLLDGKQVKDYLSISSGYAGSDSKFSFTKDDDTSQIIYYGAPGTGKSQGLKGRSNTVRITFHPDTDYASFVGCYKPIMEDDEIKYKFSPQAFFNIYVNAWNNRTRKYHLLIEEINRGNCAQIFGDIFQLLDRDDKGFSEYPIKVDEDMWKELNKRLPSDYVEFLTTYYSNTQGEGFSGEGMLALPSNLSIIATMNTSDNSLYKMDSAFKRRWDWEYIPINYNETSLENVVLDFLETPNNKWLPILKKINHFIKDSLGSTSKQIGQWFVIPEKEPDNFGKEKYTKITYKSFVNKVMFFLFNDVFKDRDDLRPLFGKDKDEEEFLFEDLVTLPEENAKELLKTFFNNLPQVE